MPFHHKDARLIEAVLTGGFGSPCGRIRAEFAQGGRIETNVRQMQLIRANSVNPGRIQFTVPYDGPTSLYGESAASWRSLAEYDAHVRERLDEAGLPGRGWCVVTELTVRGCFVEKGVLTVDYPIAKLHCSGPLTAEVWQHTHGSLPRAECYVSIGVDDATILLPYDAPLRLPDAPRPPEGVATSAAEILDKWWADTRALVGGNPGARMWK